MEHATAEACNLRMKPNLRIIPKQFCEKKADVFMNSSVLLGNPSWLLFGGAVT
jgi:hypothetical protein